jgi:hypothetical protein
MSVKIKKIILFKGKRFWFSDSYKRSGARADGLLRGVARTLPDKNKDPTLSGFLKKSSKKNGNRQKWAKMEEKWRLLIVDIFIHPDGNRWKPLNSNIIFLI